MVNKFLYLKGGSETYMFGLGNYLKSMGHLVEYFGMYDAKNTIDNSNDMLVDNLDFHGNLFLKILSSFKAIYSIEARRKIRKVVEKFNPDIVHLNNYNYQLTPSIIMELNKLNIPIVQTVHDPNLICPYHRLYNFRTNEICEKCKGNNFINCLKTRCIHNSISMSLIGTVEAYLYSYLKTYEKISYFISPSAFLAKKLLEFGINNNKIKILHNFITNNLSNKIYEKKNYVFYFGRMSYEKGIYTLLEVIRELDYIEFVFAGSGPLEEELAKYKNIQFVGFVTGNQLEKFVSESLFSLYPSEWYENCPMSVLESQMLGTPVIGSNIGGIPELIDDKIDGLLFKPGDSNDLKEKIITLYNNRDLLRSYSLKCKEKVMKFSIDNYYENIVDIYRQSIYQIEEENDG